MATKIYWALQTTYPHGFSTDSATMLSNLGTAKPSMWHLGTLQMSGGNTFSTSGLSTTAASVTALGAYPTMDLFTTLSNNVTNPTGNAWIWRNSSITAGTHDTYLHSLWASFASYGKPILVYFNSEMNGNWYPAFSDISTVNTAGSFKSAWQYCHDMAIADGATNITWALVYNIQSPNGSGAPTAETTQPMSQFWPGSTYVDVMGLDGMNFAGGMSGTGGPASGYNWFLIDEIMDGANSSGYGQSWTHLTALDATIPCTFGSFSCASAKGKQQNASWATAPILDGANKGTWFTNLSAALKAKYVRVAVYRYYNVDHAGSNSEPYAQGFSLRDNDGAFMSPYSTATTPYSYVSVDTGNSLTATVVSAGQQQTAFKALVGDTNHLQAGAFTLATTGKVPIPFVDTTDSYTSYETGVSTANLWLPMGDASKASAAVASDISGNALNGTYQGTTGANVHPALPGSVYDGFQTDGTDYVKVPDSNLLSPQVGGKIWCTLWYKLSSLPTGTITFWSKGGDVATAWEQSMDLSSALQWRWFLLTSSGTLAIGATATLTPTLSTWHCIDAAFDSTVADGTTDKTILYHDGVRIAGGSTIGANTLTNGTASFFVGRRGDNTNTVPSGTQFSHMILRGGIIPTAQQVLTGYYKGLAVLSRARVLVGD